jgi:hypothetical protein
VGGAGGGRGAQGGLVVQRCAAPTQQQLLLSHPLPPTCECASMPVLAGVEHGQRRDLHEGWDVTGFKHTNAQCGQVAINHAEQ